jgi:hypothetical protein
MRYTRLPKKILPPVVDQATDVFVVTRHAVNCCVPPVNNEAEVGEREIEMTELIVNVSEFDCVPVFRFRTLTIDAAGTAISLL